MSIHTERIRGSSRELTTERIIAEQNPETGAFNAVYVEADGVRVLLPVTGFSLAVRAGNDVGEAMFAVPATLVRVESSQ